MHTTTEAERARQYRRRIKAAGKESLRLVVSAEVAEKLRALARNQVEPVDRVLAKALRALEELKEVETLTYSASGGAS